VRQDAKTLVLSRMTTTSPWLRSGRANRGPLGLEASVTYHPNLGVMVGQLVSDLARRVRRASSMISNSNRSIESATMSKISSTGAVSVALDILYRQQDGERALHERGPFGKENTVLLVNFGRKSKLSKEKPKIGAPVRSYPL